MRKVTLFIMSAILAGICHQAYARVSRTEALSLIRNGEARQAPPTFRQTDTNGAFFDSYSQKTTHLIRGVQPEKRPSKTPGKSADRTTAGGSTVFGWQASSTADGFFPGLYALTEDKGYEIMWRDPSYFDLEENTMQTGWLSGGKVCGYVFDMYYGYIYGMWYQEMSLSDGEVLRQERLELKSSQQFTVCAYRPEDDTIYGYGLCDESYDYAFFKVSPSTPGKYDMAGTIENKDLCYAMCHNPVDDTLYGVTIRQKFVKINYDGTQEELFTLPMEDLAYYIAGMVYSPIENVFYLNVNFASTGKSAMVMISADGNVETYQNFENAESFNMLFTPDENVRQESPKRPVLSTVCFEGGATSGYNLYILPSEKVNGDEIDGKLTAVVSVDNNIYREYDGLDPGSELKVEYNDLIPGRHYFNFQVASGGFQSGSVSNEKYIGNDVPEAPSNVILTEDSLKWSPVTKGVHGGYLDLEEMRYSVFIEGEQYAVTQDTCIRINLPADRVQQKYAATVVAACHGLESEESVSNKVLWGEAYKLPVCIYPNQEQADLCTVYDGNHDNQGWYHSAVYGDFRIGYTSAGEGDVDDWMFLPYIQFDSSETLYHLSFNAGLFTTQYLEESIEILAGKTGSPEAMTIPIVKEFCLIDEDKTYEALFSVPEPGIYYVGIHCTSKENQYGLWIKNIRIEDNGITPSSPSKVSNLSAEGYPDGILRANVRFTMPASDVSGQALPADRDLTAEVRSSSLTSVTARPGEDVAVEVETKQGDNEISVTVFYNGNHSLNSTTNVFTGVTVPDSVTNIRSTVSSDMRSVTMTWDAPDTGENEGYIVPSELVYHIYKHAATDSGTSQLVEIATTTECEYTYTNCDYQEYLDLGVAAGNAAGICQKVIGVSEVVGLPYDLPMIENFDDPNGNFAHNPWLTYRPTSDYSANWTVGSLHDVNASFDDRKSLAIIANERYDSGKGCLGMPRFTTEDEPQATVTISVYDGPDSGTMSITGECSLMDEKIILGETTPSCETPAFTEYSFPVPEELLGKPWVQLYIECHLPDPTHKVAFNRIEIKGSRGAITSSNIETPSVRTGKGHITVSGCEDCNISVCGLNGISIFNGKSGKDNLRINTPPGIYTVCIDGYRVKATVK